MGSLPHAPAERPKVATTKMGQQVAARLDARLNVQLQDSLNEDQRDLALYSRLIGEVGVNGFHGMFTNTLGNKALRTREAIVRMGPPELLAVYDCALTAFPSSTPHQRSDKRFDELRAWSEPGLFRELDQRVSDLTASHELDKAMDDYVSRHPAL
ncbi:MAG: DUF4375 domain-containing protein [Myxococcaceae bacterium]|nr:DUF4375 domain-containing protein [Myxococcaceae bacterium]